MDPKDTYKYLIGAYYGIQEMDNYPLKEYILKDIKDYIEQFIKDNPIKNYDYKKEEELINKELSIKTKLQDSLLVLPKINAPMELTLLVKEKLKELKEKK